VSIEAEAAASAAGRRGLHGLRARARDLGGEARIEPLAGGGTRVLLSVPLRAGERAAGGGSPPRRGLAWLASRVRRRGIA
jgi:hypothetical protein